MENVMNLLILSTVAEMELVYKPKVKPSQRPFVKTSKDCYDIPVQNWDQNKIEFVKQFKIVLMNKANRVLGIYELSTGGVSGTAVDAKLIFVAALKANACNIILSRYEVNTYVK